MWLVVHDGGDGGRCCGECGLWCVVMVIVGGDCGCWCIVVVIVSGDWVGGGMVVDGGGSEGWRCWTILGYTLLFRFLFGVDSLCPENRFSVPHGCRFTVPQYRDTVDHFYFIFFITPT